MIIKAKIKTNAKKNSIEKLSDGSYLITTSALPIEGQANRAVIELLSDYLGIAKSKISIKKGQKSKNKIFNISG